MSSLPEGKKEKWWSQNFVLPIYNLLSVRRVGMKSFQFFPGTLKLLSLEIIEQSLFYWDCKASLRRLLALEAGIGWYFSFSLSFPFVECYLHSALWIFLSPFVCLLVVKATQSHNNGSTMTLAMLFSFFFSL